LRPQRQEKNGSESARPSGNEGGGAPPQKSQCQSDYSAEEGAAGERLGVDPLRAAYQNFSLAIPGVLMYEGRALLGRWELHEQHGPPGKVDEYSNMTPVRLAAQRRKPDMA